MSEKTTPTDRPTREEVERWVRWEGFGGGNALRRLARAYLEVLEEWERILREECAPDEVHCTCVPTLRAENSRLRIVVEAAKLVHWPPEDRSNKVTPCPLCDALAALEENDG